VETDISHASNQSISGSIAVRDRTHVFITLSISMIPGSEVDEVEEVEVEVDEVEEEVEVDEVEEVEVDEVEEVDEEEEDIDILDDNFSSILSFHR